MVYSEEGARFRLMENRRKTAVINAAQGLLHDFMQTRMGAYGNNLITISVMDIMNALNGNTQPPPFTASDVRSILKVQTDTWSLNPGDMLVSDEAHQAGILAQRRQLAKDRCVYLGIICSDEASIYMVLRVGLIHPHPSIPRSSDINRF